MPNEPVNRVLRGGEFYSPVMAKDCREHLLLTELHQPEAGKSPRHEHQLAYFTLALDGYYAETERHITSELHAFTALYNPAGAAHESCVGRGGARLFMIELQADFLTRLDIHLPDCPHMDLGADGMLWPGLRIYNAFKAQLTDALTLESHVIEMLGSLAGPGKESNGAPRWFYQIKDRLHHEFDRNLRISELAAQAGVHPVHLARVFRKQAGQTAGDYLQRLRVNAACRLLRDREMPLVSIAADCGFADQSHFTRLFKKFTGVTPREFRKLQSS
jgi:AraC family transcriptional regulator